MYASLAERLLGQLDASKRPLLDGVDLPASLRTVIESGRARWPDVSPQLEPLVDDLGRHLSAAEDPVAHLDHLVKERAADVYFAAACGQGDAMALRLFEAKFFPDALAGLARLNLNAGVRDEVAQQIRQKLFVGDGQRRPAILEYSGRGDLRGFLRVTTMRIAVSHLRRAQDEVPLEEEVMRTLPSGDRDPELEHFRRRYTDEFRQALAEAIAAISAEERTLLRYYLIDKMTIDQVGALFQVHRVTAFRRIERAQKKLVDRTLRSLKDRLRVGETELQSILGLLQSRFEMSVHRLLGDAPPEE